MAEPSPFVKFINIYVEMYTLIVQAPLQPFGGKLGPGNVLGGNRLIKKHPKSGGKWPRFD